MVLAPVVAAVAVVVILVQVEAMVQVWPEAPVLPVQVHSEVLWVGFMYRPA